MAVGEGGGRTTEPRIVIVDWTAPVTVKSSIQPAGDIERGWDEGADVSFTGVPGPTAPYQLLTGVAGIGRDGLPGPASPVHPSGPMGVL